MSSLGKIYGIALTAAKSLLDQIGVTVGGVYSPPAGAGQNTWTEVGTLSALNAAIEDGARILITHTIAMTGSNTISLPTSGQLTIGRKTGVQITHSGSTAMFTLASGSCKLRLVDSNDSDDVPFLLPNGGGSPFVATSGNLTIEWDRLTISATGSILVGGSGITFLGGKTHIVGANQSASFLFSGYIASVVHTGGGSSASIVVGGHIGHLKCDGTYRSYTTNNSSTTYAVLVGNATSDCSRVDAIDGDGLTSSALIYVSSLAGVGRIDASCKIAVQARATVENAGSISQLVAVSAFLSGTIRRALFGSAILFETNGGNLVLEDCYFAGANTIPSGSGLVFRGGTLQSGASMTFSSGSKSSLYDFVNDSGTITIDSGAAIRSERLSSTGGTITNNDPLSILTGSDNPALDTTPVTRGFANSSGVQNATLNTELLPYIVGYWDGASLPGPNRGPALPGCVGGPICDNTATKALSVVGGKIDVDSGAERFQASLQINIFSSDYFLSLFFTPDDATPPGETHLLILQGASGVAIGLDVLSSGALRVYHNGAGSFGDSSAAVLSDGVESRITLLRRNNAGTNTIYFYVDGVEVGALTGKTLGLNESSFLSNTNSTAGHVGQYRRILVAIATISEATENLLDTHWLQGAGNA